MMNKLEALAFVETHGIVTESAHSSVPNLVEAVLGEPVTGSWWAHPLRHEVFRIIRAVRSSPDVLVCRLAEGKVTFVHRRLWPHLVRLAGELDAKRVAAVREIHTPAGHHIAQETPFPEWVAEEVVASAHAISLEQAREALRRVL